VEEHFDPNIPCSVWNHQSAGQRTAHTGLLDEAVYVEIGFGPFRSAETRPDISTQFCS
jgi:hypothetical protein